MRTKTITALIKAAAGDDETDSEDSGLGAGQFTAYASVFGNVDSYGEVVEKGAFANTLADWKGKGAPIPLYWAHQMDNPRMNIGHVQPDDAVEDDIGLLVRGQFDVTGNPDAAYAYELVKSKRVNQMSFAYDVLGAEDHDDYIALTELKLHEVSVVPVGANQETSILDVKGLVAQEISRHLTDLRPTKSGRVLSAKNESAIRTAIKALEDVLANLGQDGSAGDDGKSIVPASFTAIAALTGRM